MSALPSRLAALGLVLAVAGCAPAAGRPRDKDDAGPGAAGRIGPLDFGFPWLQDRYAVMGRWYDYENVGHTLSPRPFAWILAEGEGAQARYAAFRIVSYYDEQTAEPGRITLSLSTWDGSAFSAEQEWTASKNIKEERVPVCLDVFARAEVDCGGGAWQLMLRMYRDMSVLSAIVIRDPGVFLRSWSGRPDLGSVRVARIDDKTDLSGLPDPTTLGALQEGPPPADWTTTDWDFSSYASNLPENGMALGSRFVDEGFVGREDIYFLINGKFTLARFVVKPKQDGDLEQGLVFQVSTSAIVREDFSVEADPPVRTVEVAMPAVGEVAYLSFEQEDLLSLEADLEGSSWPFLPPDNNDWDLALERLDADTARLLVSPASAVLDVIPHLCDPENPPPIEEMDPPILVEDPDAEPCAPEN